MNKILLATTAFATVAVSASAVDVEIYGQVNKGLFAIDDGENTDVSIIDNDFSSTRLGFKGAQALDNGLTASVLLEGEIQSNASDTITQNTAAGQSSTPASIGGTFDERQARVGLGGSWGAVFLGQQSIATDSVAEQDLVGARDVMGSDVEDIGGGYVIQDAAGTNTLTVADLQNNLDGGRADSIRYDTPIFNGFQGRISTSQGGDVDAAVYYAGEAASLKVKGGLGYFVNNDAVSGDTTAIDDGYVGSLSVKHESGLAGTVSYGDADGQTAAGDTENLYLKAGYAWDNKEVAIDYSASEVGDNELDAYGIAGQMNLGHGVSVSALYRQFDADIAGLSTEEIDVYGVNMRVKF